jgi:hypothetical protein
VQFIFELERENLNFLVICLILEAEFAPVGGEVICKDGKIIIFR